MRGREGEFPEIDQAVESAMDAVAQAKDLPAFLHGLALLDRGTLMHLVRVTAQAEESVKVLATQLEIVKSELRVERSSRRARRPKVDIPGQVLIEGTGTQG